MPSCDSVFYILTIACLQNVSGLNILQLVLKIPSDSLVLLGCDSVVGCVVPDMSMDHNTVIFMVKQGKAVTHLLALLDPEYEGIMIL
jgi:hypothetical protein